MAFGTGLLIQDVPEFTEDTSATLTLDKRVPLFDGNQGDKKERDVMVHPLEPGLIQSAGLAHPGGVIQGHGPGLYAANKEKHGVLPDF